MKENKCFKCANCGEYTTVLVERSAIVKWKEVLSSTGTCLYNMPMGEMNADTNKIESVMCSTCQKYVTKEWEEFEREQRQTKRR